TYLSSVEGTAALTIVIAAIELDDDQEPAIFAMQEIGYRPSQVARVMSACVNLQVGAWEFEDHMSLMRRPLSELFHPMPLIRKPLQKLPVRSWMVPVRLPLSRIWGVRSTMIPGAAGCLSRLGPVYMAFASGTTTTATQSSSAFGAAASMAYRR